MNYIVYRGEYPFTEELGMVKAPADQPEVALDIAITVYGDIDAHPVVEPINVQ